MYLKMVNFKSILLYLLLCSTSQVNSGLLCEEGFCRDYGFDVGCASPAEHCFINNATHSGILLPSPTICNCCQYCLPFINENEPCSLGGPGLGTTVGRCGAGLYCVAGDEENYCRRMESECHSEQDRYDERHANGLTFALETRPLCDDKGKFAPINCDPTSTCYCQSEDGERIFGEFLYMGEVTLLNSLEQCGCSRMNYKLKNSIGSNARFPVITPRCTSDGKFNPIQCIDSTCYCVDRITGKIDDTKSIDLNHDPVSKLPCYDLNLDLFAERGDEPPFNFTSPCLEEQKWIKDLYEEWEEDGFSMEFFNVIPECEPDGTYGITKISENGTKICVDELGDQMKDYEALPETEEFNNMNCRCALTSHIMASLIEKPVCCRNGNFRPIQCRRGICYCVNDDGRQTEVEQDDITRLSCYKEDWRTC